LHLRLTLLTISINFKSFHFHFFSIYKIQGVFSEALIRRVLQGKGVYRINNIVEINNLISLKSKFPVGSYDIDNLSSPISLTLGKSGEEYKGIGKENIKTKNLPVLADSLGSFGSPTSD
jgi:DNA/RNA-binding domain of Phe-tRNA-synthetase-like protein